jgi:hypothetical protein
MITFEVTVATLEVTVATSEVAVAVANLVTNVVLTLPLPSALVPTNDTSDPIPGVFLGRRHHVAHQMQRVWTVMMTMRRNEKSTMLKEKIPCLS